MNQTPIGTWMVHGVPKGQPRPRAFSRGGRASVYDPGTAEGWKSQVALALVGMRQRMLPCPIGLELTFYMPRPKSHLRANGTLKPSAPISLFCSKPDADNLAKAVMDAMTTIGVWQDDCQVCKLIVRKCWAATKASCGAVITITDLTEK